MGYLVSSTPPASNGIRTPNLAIFEDLAESDSPPALDRAKAEAERLLNTDHTEVRVWKLYASPTLTRTVIWEAPDND